MTTIESNCITTDYIFSTAESLHQRFEKSTNVSSLMFNFNLFIMSLRNKVMLIGHTGKETEVVNFENGSMKASVSLATKDFYTNAQGEKVEETQWHNLIAFGKTAEIMQKFVTKGKEIAVEGKITYRNYETQDGQKRYLTEIRVEELVLLGGK